MLGVRCWSLIVGDSGGNKSRQLVLCAVAGNFSGNAWRKFFRHVVSEIFPAPGGKKARQFVPGFW